MMRERQGLSLDQLEAKSKGELIETSVSRVDIGVRTPALATLEALATHLPCTFVVGPRKTYIAEFGSKPKTG